MHYPNPVIQPGLHDNCEPKPEYLKLLAKLQFVCPHNFGTLHNKTGNCCAYCGWPDGKCQHKTSLNRNDKFCSECGEKL